MQNKATYLNILFRISPLQEAVPKFRQRVAWWGQLSSYQLPAVLVFSLEKGTGFDKGEHQKGISHLIYSKNHTVSHLDPKQGGIFQWLALFDCFWQGTDSCRSVWSLEENPADHCRALWAPGNQLGVHGVGGGDQGWISRAWKCPGNRNQ